MPRYNKSPNPCCLNNATGWVGAGQSGSTTVRATGLNILGRTTGYRVTAGSVAGASYIWGAPYQTGVAGRLTGERWTANIMGIASVATNMYCYLSYYNTSNAQIAAFATGPYAVPPYTVLSVPVSGIAPANASGVTAATGVETLPANATFWATLCRVEQIEDPNLQPADGASGGGWVWDGTAGSSSSTRAVDDGAEWWSMFSL